MSYNKKRGFTLIELLISLTILSMLGAIAFWHFMGVTKEEALKKDRQGLVALLLEARSLSLASKDAKAYGVHIEEFKAELFTGSVYSADPSNRIHEFHSAVRVSSFALEGGGNDIVFSRLTGSTLNYGTITLSLRDNPLSSSVVNIKDTGVVE